MSRMLMLSASAIALACLPAAAFAQDGDGALTDIITVTGFAPTTPLSSSVEPAASAPAGPDAVTLIARLPGAAAVGNGPMSGQVQYRGLFGPRLNVRIDGQAFDSAGPNLMDPPLHYAPMPLIDHIEVDRGVSPVRNGPGLAGGVNAVLKRVDFTDSASPSLSYDLTLGGRSADSSYAAGGLVGLSTDTVRLQALASREQGDDLRYPGGRIGGSGHERLVYGLGAGLRTGRHEFSLDARRQETGATGNAPFAMDIRFFDSDILQAGYRGEFDGFTVQVRLGQSDINHAMNNYDLRPAPASPMLYREALATGLTRTASADIAFDGLGGQWRFGLDSTAAEHDLVITNPANTAFYLHSLPDIEMDRSGAFAEWTGPIAGWNSEIGLRIDRHDASAGTASTGPAVPAMPGMLAMAFNMSPRSLQDDTVDGVLRLWRPLNEATTLRLTLARKTRAPGYVERFAWLPTEASGGLADGNTYIGDPGLVPETAWIAEAGLDWQTGNAYARPTVFYRSIEDYIQGVAYDGTPGIVDSPVEMVSAMNGDPTPLRFANTDARLYGFDMDFGVRLDAAWRLDGTASWVRGERRDIDDDLYRIAPPSLRLGLTRDAASWSATLETVAVAEQTHVSTTNSEAATDGFVLVNLYGSWAVRDGVSVSAGIENVFDERYRQHLAGYNRNSGSDVALGERLPGAGRSVGLRLTLRS